MRSGSTVDNGVAGSRSASYLAVVGFAPTAGYNGSNVRRFRAQVFAVYGDTCHLCARPGADTVDHVIPRKLRPDLAFDIGNARPAHLSCNSRRGAAPLPTTYTARAW